MSERRNFTKDEDSYIIQNYYTVLHKNIAEYLDRKIKSIRKRAKKLGLDPKKINRRWTPEEDEIIRNRGTETISDIARKLDRCISETCKRAKHIGCGFAGITTRRKDGYLYKRIPNGDGTRTTVWKHIEIIEKHIGRSLKKPELVHHIDCDKGNNELSNLWLCGSVGEHSKAHRSLEKLLPILIRDGIVSFNRENGIYELCKKETISDS
ncbi:HNH endonuclease [Treponema sp. R6D11]